MCPLALLESLALNLRAVDNYTEVLVGSRLWKLASRMAEEAVLRRINEGGGKRQA